MKLIGLILLVLVCAQTLVQGAAQGSNYWTTFTQYSDSECTQVTGFIIGVEGSCTPVSECTATEHGAYYKKECIDRAVGPTPHENLPAVTSTVGWSIATTHQSNDCSDYAGFVSGPPNECLILGASYVSIKTDCDPANPATLALYTDACVTEVMAFSVPTLDTCTLSNSISLYASCNYAPPVADVPVAAPLAPVAAPVADIPVAAPSAPVTAPVAAPGQSKSDAVSVAVNGLIGTVLATAVLVLF